MEGIVCPPVKPETKPSEGQAAPANDTSATGLEYERYLHEVVSVLEEDPAFKKKLEDSDINYIKSGEIANDLDLVNHNIRERLDEIKRIEVTRLKSLVQEQFKMKAENRDSKHIPLQHINLANTHSFEATDLAKLIKQATMDLDELDRQRKAEFKAYEMRKEHEKNLKLADLNSTQRAAEEAHLKEMEDKHKSHTKLHHPMGKAQLEEVWEESDHLNPEDFDPKTFFKLHDINGDNVLDPTEVEALFTKEIAKMYDPNNPEDDMREAQEEINRMREHVFKEADLDGNHVLDQNEFEALTKKEEFNKDEGWKGLDEDNDIYSDEEMAEYERHLKQEENRLHEQNAYEHVVPGQVNQPIDPNVVHMQQPTDLPQGMHAQEYVHLQQQPQQQQQQQQLQFQRAQFAQEQELKHSQFAQQPVQHQQQPIQHQQVQQPVAHQQQPPQPPGHQQVAAAAAAQKQHNAAAAPADHGPGHQ